MISLNDSHFSGILLPRERKVIQDLFKQIPQRLQSILVSETTAGNKILHAFQSGESVEFQMEYSFFFTYQSREIVFEQSTDPHQSGEFYFQALSYVVSAPLQRTSKDRVVIDL